MKCRNTTASDGLPDPGNKTQEQLCRINPDILK